MYMYIVLCMYYMYYICNTISYMYMESINVGVDTNRFYIYALLNMHHYPLAQQPWVLS